MKITNLTLSFSIVAVLATGFSARAQVHPDCRNADAVALIAADVLDSKFENARCQIKMKIFYLAAHSFCPIQNVPGAADWVLVNKNTCPKRGDKTGGILEYSADSGFVLNDE